jgi:hypothetical protein
MYRATDSVVVAHVLMIRQERLADQFTRSRDGGGGGDRVGKKQDLRFTEADANGPRLGHWVTGASLALGQSVQASLFHCKLACPVVELAPLQRLAERVAVPAQQGRTVACEA